MEKDQSKQAQGADSTQNSRRDFVKKAAVAAGLMALGSQFEILADTKSPEGLTDLSGFGPHLACGIIGMGSWGREILAEWLKLGSKAPVAVCDTYPGALKRAEAIAPKAQQFSDYRKLLECKDIPAIIVATPTHLHRDIVLDALAAGKHVYCEAPLASNLEDARIIAKAAKNTPTCLFHSGMLFRTSPERQLLFNYIKAGALGQFVMGRAQWHYKKSWRAVSQNPDREKELNWRLSKEISSGLVGEVGIHSLDFFTALMGVHPVAVSGLGSICVHQDGRDVPDTVLLTYEYPRGARLIFDATLGNSCESEYNVIYGTQASYICRRNIAYMFKEEDSPLSGWEVYVPKVDYFGQTNLSVNLYPAPSMSIRAHRNGSWQNPQKITVPPLFYALDVFRRNADYYSRASTDFYDLYGKEYDAELRQYLSTIKPVHFPGWKEGYEATVIALKGNEAVMTGERIEFLDEWFVVD